MLIFYIHYSNYRVPKAGICHGLILSQAFVIRPKGATKHDIKENMGNHLRFRAVLKELETPNDYVMILRSSVNPEKSAIRYTCLKDLYLYVYIAEYEQGILFTLLDGVVS